ncbi:MAG: hypothetical protein V5783_10865 [Pontiella sp.]
MKNPPPAKEGIALVMVLGFLALLLVMILAFAARTRTDRLAGRAYLENARAHQLLHTALARAMEDLDHAFSTNYPQELALGSLGNSGRPISGGVNFSTERDYLPLGNPAISNAFEAELRLANWENIFVNHTNIGRIAYVLVNTSGLLDANAVGATHADRTPYPRRHGLSPKEIQLSDLLPEMNPSSAPTFVDPSTGSLEPAPDMGTAFIHNRDNAWQRFETLRDIKTLNDSPRGGGISGNIASFNTFSLFPTNTFQGLELTEELDEESFKTTLIQHCGFSATEAEHIVDNYFDYIDADHIPRNLSGSSPEAVPMLNEIWLEFVRFDSNRIDPTQVTYTLSGELHIETWFPFNEPLAAPTFLEIMAADPITLSSTNSGNRLELLAGEHLVDRSSAITVLIRYTHQTKAFILPLEELYVQESSDHRFMEYAYSFSFSDTLELQVPLTTDTPPVAIRFLNESFDVIQKGTVDRVEHTDLELRLAESQEQSTVSYGCYDPRLNHDFGDRQQWGLMEQPTPNAINIHENWGEEQDLAQKEALLFFVSNLPITNTAELGHLSTGKPWDTIRLYAAGDDPDPVLDYFYTQADLSHAPVRPGLININSPHSNVLATAFYRAPFPSAQDASLAISSSQAQTLGQNLAALAGRDHPRSHVGHALSDNLAQWETLTDAQKEALVGNTYRLFGSRDTSYTLLLIAQTGTDRDGNGLDEAEIRATQQAVVNIWRDPKTGKSAITFFGLSDTLRRTIGSTQSWGDLLQDFQPD